MSKSSVYIDPTCKIVYSSYYIQGLYNIYGKENVKFSSKYFRELQRYSESHSFDHYMAFVVKENDVIKRYIIDFRDKQSVKESAYNWCDVYAKINFSPQYTDKRFHEKMLSIPPGFGIRIWSKRETLYYAFSNLLKTGIKPVRSIRFHFTDYNGQLRRSAISDYTQFPDTVNNYVFMIGTLWSHNNCMEGTNPQRKAFVEACKANKLNFEGGFFARPTHPQYEEFRNIIFTTRYKTLEYISKTRSSMFVFNTPAVHKCHGWKLGEFLAMGKAIISTPLSNALPDDLRHGENIHFINNMEEMNAAVQKLASDEIYRNKLAQGARDYYEKYASPKAVIKWIIDNKKNTARL